MFHVINSAATTMKKTILIVDDEEHIRTFMCDLLRQNNYEPLAAPDGEAAIAILERIRVDLIMLDMNMPKMDGIAFLRHIREHKITSSPVLMLTGSYDKTTMLECYKLGVYDFIKKPEELEIMLKRIENGLKIGELIYFHEFIQLELDTARKFQKYLYPDTSMRDIHSHIEVVFHPLSDIGGDFYDYIKFRDQRLLFCVADISGHSISAAMYIAMLKMMFRKAIKEIDSPGGILTQLNREIAENLPVETFVTMFCGLIDPSQTTLHYANAGHPFPYFIQNGVAFPLEKHDQFLGPIKNAQFSTFTASITGWEGMFIFTDGILDIGPQNNGNYGIRQLHDTLNQSNAAINEKFEKIKNYLSSSDTKINDDCTLMMIEFSR